MSSTGAYDDQVRAKADELAKRMQSDAQFRQQIEADPVAALTGAGLPADAASDFLLEYGQTNDVSGYLWCRDTCLGDSSCVSTCLLTRMGP